MSLFIGSLAFGTLGGAYPAMVRTGVIVGSLASGILGYLFLRVVFHKPYHPVLTPQENKQEIETHENNDKDF